MNGRAEATGEVGRRVPVWRGRDKEENKRKEIHAKQQLIRRKIATDWGADDQIKTKQKLESCGVAGRSRAVQPKKLMWFQS